MTKPIVAVVQDHTGTYLRIAGDVTIVWVDPDAKNDRVFEVSRRETAASLKRYLGDPRSWGNDKDDTQKQLEEAMDAVGLVKPGRKHVRKIYASSPPVAAQDQHLKSNRRAPKQLLRRPAPKAR